MRRLLWLGDSLLIVLGVVGLLTSDRVQNFAGDNGVLMYAVSLVLLLVVGLVVDRLLTMRIQRDEARSRYPKITRRDQELFNRIEHEMGRATQATAYLQAVFDGKSWQWTPMQPYLSFADDWGHNAMFDDPVMERELRKFHSVARDFYGDAAVESGHPDDRDPHDRYAVLNEGGCQMVCVSGRSQQRNDDDCCDRRDRATGLQEGCRRSAC